jgi:hypothetical protein
VRAPDQKAPTLEPFEGALSPDRDTRQSLVSGLGGPCAEESFERLELGTLSLSSI